MDKADHPHTLIRHGNAVRIDQHWGVLIFGPHGCGKSLLCAALLERGHELIADDAVKLMRKNKHLIAQAADETRSYLHLPGAGLINVHDIYGSTAICEQASVHCIINIVPVNTLQPHWHCSERSLSLCGLPCLVIDLPTTSNVIHPIVFEKCVQKHLQYRHMLQHPL